MKEYVWTITGLCLSGIFVILGTIFLIFKEKACSILSGYNSKTKKEREEYDEVLLSKDERNFFYTCALINFIGAVISIFLGVVSFWIAFVVWLVFFMKNVHFDPDKAFAKYKRKTP